MEKIIWHLKQRENVFFFHNFEFALLTLMEKGKFCHSRLPISVFEYFNQFSYKFKDEKAICRLHSYILCDKGQSKGWNREHSQDSPKNKSSQQVKEEGSIYHEIMGQMELNHSEYINKLLVKQEREEKSRTKRRQEENRSENKHERNKSYTNIIIENMGYNI